MSERYPRRERLEVGKRLRIEALLDRLNSAYRRSHPLRENLVCGLVKKMSNKEITLLECVFDWSPCLGDQERRRCEMVGYPGELDEEAFRFGWEWGIYPVRVDVRKGKEVSE